jgi:hypothetical protein
LDYQARQVALVQLALQDQPGHLDLLDLVAILGHLATQDHLAMLELQDQLDQVAHEVTLV